MSLPVEEREAMRRVWRFLLDLGDSYGPWKGVPSAVRREARSVSRHYPLGGDPHSLERDARERGS